MQTKYLLIVLDYEGQESLWFTSEEKYLQFLRLLDYCDLSDSVLFSKKILLKALTIISLSESTCLEMTSILGTTFGEVTIPKLIQDYYINAPVEDDFLNFIEEEWI